MPGDRSINAGRDILGNIIITGDRNRVDAKLTQISLPPMNSVDIVHELTQIKIALEKGGARGNRSLDEAVTEASKPTPDKDKIGSALRRGLEYAKEGNSFADEIGKLAPHVASVVAWLGSNWHTLLPIVGLTL